MRQVPVVRAMPEKKPFLGGFRHRKTRLEYHHASTQTEAPAKSAEELAAAAGSKFHRETQTAIVVTRSQQGVRESGTQMGRGYLREDDENDRVITPLPYFDSAMLARLQLQKAIDIQRYTRGAFARGEAGALRRARAAAAAAEAEAEARLAAEAEKRHKEEIQRRMHPQTGQDFDLLYNELEAWRLQETRRIKEGDADEAEKGAELEQLLLKEQKLLQTIDRLHIQASEENREKRIRSALESMSAPKRWQMSDGEIAQACRDRAEIAPRSRAEIARREPRRSDARGW